MSLTTIQLDRARKMLRHLEHPAEARQADAPPALEDEVCELIDAAVTLFYDGPKALQRARDFGGRGYAGGGGGEGSGKGGHSSPTERAALSDRPDDFTAKGQTILAKTTEAAAAGNVAARLVRDLLTTAPPVSDVDSKRCKTPGCEDIDGRDGYCLSCHRYVERNGHMPSADTIQARRDGRRLQGSTS